MKKCLFFAAAASVTFALVFSCAKEEAPSEEKVQTSVEEPAASEPGETIVISAVIPENLTKVSFDPSYPDGKKPESMSLTWKDSDKLLVADHDNPSSSAEFTLTSGAGGKQASFSGTAPAGATSYDVSIVNGDVSGAQASDGDTSHLQYLASKKGVTDLSSISFDTFNSILAITAMMPSTAIAAKIKSVDITASAAIFNGSNTLNITLTNLGDTDTDGILHLFANLPEGDQAVADGTTLLVKFNAPGESHDVYTRYIVLGAQTFTNNKLNTININASQSDTHAGLTSCDGTSVEKAYLIGDKYQMNAIHGKLSATKKYYKMVDDIDMTGVSWAPLATLGSEQIDFDGGNHKLDNLTAPAANFVSIFGLLTGRVANLTIDNATITPGGQRAGVLASYIGTGSGAGVVDNITIKNSQVGTSSSKGTNYCGILAAFVNHASTTISNVRIENCSVYSTNSVTNSDGKTYTCTGGMVATTNSNAASFTDCHLTECTVSGGNMTGGFVGNSSGQYSQCSVAAAVTGGHHTGGFAGKIVAATTINECYTAGTVAGGNNVGGFIGWAQFKLTMNNCYSTANVGTSDSRAGNRVGGLIGHYTKDNNSSAGPCTVSYCFTSGDIYSASPAGGIIGQFAESDGTLEKCIAWNANVNTSSAQATAAAVIGNSHQNATLTDNYRKSDMNVSTTWSKDWTAFNHANASSSTPLTGSNGNALTDKGPYFGKVDNGKTIFEIANTLGWDASIWNLSSGSHPTLISNPEP